MEQRHIRTQRAVESCDVCGRTLLPGERAEPYLAGGERKAVCELCGVRATRQGWIREAAQVEVTGREDEERATLFGRLRGRRERLAREGEEMEPEEASELEALEAEEAAAHEALPEPRVPAADPYDPGAEPRHVQAVPTSGEMKASQALDHFNASEHPRTVAGVARSLGAPTVAVRSTPDRLSVVTIVVSWELCWYRYEVDLADGGNGVHLEGQGYELSELSDDDRTANASAGQTGRLQLGAPTA